MVAMPVEMITGLPVCGAGLEQVGPEQLIGRDLVEGDVRLKLLHRFQIERRAGKGDVLFPAAAGDRLQMLQRQFPGDAFPVLRAFGQDFRREQLRRRGKAGI